MDDKKRLVSSSASSSDSSSVFTSPLKFDRMLPPKQENLTTFTKEMRKRQFRIIDMQKASKPQQLDEVDWQSPRSEDSFVIEPTASSGVLLKMENLETVSKKVNPLDRSGNVIIQIDEAETLKNDKTDIDEMKDDHNTLAPSTLPNVSSRSNSVFEENIRDQISVEMRSRIHSIASGVQRRTSVVRESLIEGLPDDVVSLASTIPKNEERRPSLMSLIGLQKRSSSPTAETTSKTVCGVHFNETFHPYGRLYMTWLSIVTSCFLYNAFCIPLRSSYPYQTTDNWMYWFLVDYIADAIYFIDMLFIKPRLRFTRGGIQVKNYEQTRKHYFMTRTFKLDILSSFPTDLIYFLVGKKPIWRLNRVLKINSFWLLFDMLDNSFSNPYAIRIARTLSYMIYIIHCNSCVYYKLSAMQAFGQIAYHENGKWYLNKWVYNNQGNAYIRCFYFTASVATSTGNNPAPTNVIEYIYMTCSWMMGVFVFALLLGQIRDIVSNANRNREDFQRKMDMALSECTRLNLTKDLTDRVRDWFIYTWQQQKTLDEKKLIEKLPLKLQTDLALSVHYTTLSKVQLFQDCDRALLRDLVLKLRPVIFLPGDLICKKGDVGKEMYIVNQGVLEVFNIETGDVFVTLKQGAVFGEISLLAIGGNNRRTASIRAKGYATLFVLAKEDLNDVIRYYPQAQSMLKRKAAQILKEDEKKKAAANSVQKVEEQTMEDICKINPVATPKMFKIVTEVLPKDGKVTQELMKAIEVLESRRHSVYPWSTLQRHEDEDSVSDISEISDIDDDDDHENPLKDVDPLEDVEFVETPVEDTATKKEQ